MKSNKLFNVLVLGGALLTSPNGFAENGALLGQEVQEVFCNSSDSCEKVPSCGAEGQLQFEYVVKEGLVCCWGTACSDLNSGE